MWKPLRYEFSPRAVAMSDAAAGREHGESGRRYWIPAVIAALSMFLGVLDTSMMNVGVPSIVADLHTTVSAMQSAIAVYSMVMAARIITDGALRAAIDTK
jgi:hypothetical protein